MARPIDLDYLHVAGPVLARLRERLSEVHPSSIVQIEQIGQADGGAISPFVYLLWEGDQVKDSDETAAKASSTQVVGQLWTVLLYVRNASQVDASARNTQAGPLLSQINLALSGFLPAGCLRPFRRVQGRPAQYRTNSALYPLTFLIPQYL
jgi:hypothetical protein